MICAKLRLIIYANSYSDLIMLRPNGVAKGPSVPLGKHLTRSYSVILHTLPLLFQEGLLA